MENASGKSENNAREGFKYTLSFSALAAFALSPQDFITYKRRENKDTNATELGSMSHTKVFEGTAVFEEKYLVSDVKEITGMLGKFLQVYADTNDVQTAYNHSGYKLKIETVSEYLSKPENKEYISMLRRSKGKLVVDPEKMSRLAKMELNLRKHKKASKLLFSATENTNANCKAYNELDIRWQYPKTNIIMNSRLDRLIVDYTNKKITLIDYKTTAKPVHQFKVSYRKYNYHWQMFLYVLAVRSWLAKQGIDAKEFECEYYIVVTQTTGHHSCRVFTVHIEDLKLAREQILSLLPDIIFHMEIDEWEHETEYYQGDGSSVLRIA